MTETRDEIRRIGRTVPLWLKAETRDEAIARLEASGDLVKDCKGCADRYAAVNQMPWEVFAPHHKASSRCQSGKRNHCTCDTCF